MYEFNEKTNPTNTAIEQFKRYIVNALVRECGEQNRKAAERCAQKKYELLLADLTRVYFNPVRHIWFQDRPEIKLYSSKSYECVWGRITIKGKQLWLNSLLGRYLFTVLREGDNLSKIASAIEFTKPIVVSAIMQYAVQNPSLICMSQPTQSQTDNFEYFDTLIDIDSLDAYIHKVSADIVYEFELSKHSVSENHLHNIVEAQRYKTQRCWEYANKLRAALMPTGTLRQAASISDAGRLYFKGVNLQSAPKEVRHAALGYSVSYDLRCGALGVFAALANGLTDGTWKFHAIRRYIKHRHEIRAAITRAIYPELSAVENVEKFFGYYKVKEAFTAIGFGARKSGGFWKDESGNWMSSSLKTILGDRVEEFLKQKLVQEIVDEYELAGKLIYAIYKSNDLFRSYLLENSQLDAPLNRKQLLAHIYQHFESVILATLIDAAQKQGAKLLLPIHDGAYFDRSFDCFGICYLMRLPFIQEKSFIQFERSMHCSQARYDALKTTGDEHRKLIRLTEIEASNYRCYPFNKINGEEGAANMTA